MFDLDLNFSTALSMSVTYRWSLRSFSFLWENKSVGQWHCTTRVVHRKFSGRKKCTFLRSWKKGGSKIEPNLYCQLEQPSHSPDLSPSACLLRSTYFLGTFFSCDVKIHQTNYYFNMTNNFFIFIFLVLFIKDVFLLQLLQL